MKAFRSICLVVLLLVALVPSDAQLTKWTSTGSGDIATMLGYTPVASDNWTASGTTNSTLSGVLTANAGTITNTLTATTLTTSGGTLSSTAAGTFTISAASGQNMTLAPGSGGGVFIGSNQNMNMQGTGHYKMAKTITAGGTTGGQTINKPSGSVNFAGTAQSLIVTNSIVDANSIIMATVATDDTTAKSCIAVPGSGAFTLKLNAAATAETRVQFLITN